MGIEEEIETKCISCVKLVVCKLVRRKGIVGLI
jgi:hypothetical protein